MERKIYVAPDFKVNRVQLENAICSGSADIEANTPGAEGTSTTRQVINQGFESDNNGLNSDIPASSWDN